MWPRVGTRRGPGAGWNGSCRAEKPFPNRDVETTSSYESTSAETQIEKNSILPSPACIIPDQHRCRRTRAHPRQLSDVSPSAYPKEISRSLPASYAPLPLSSPNDNASHPPISTCDLSSHPIPPLRCTLSAVSTGHSSCFTIPQTLGLNHSYARVNNGAPFSAWKGVMHTILLLYRSVVLASTTPDVSAGSDGGGGGDGGGAGGGEPTLDFVIQPTRCVDHTVPPGGVRNRGNQNADTVAGENMSPRLLQTQPSVSADIEWAAAQARADAEAAAAEANEEIGYASGVGLESGEAAEGGDCDVGLGGDSAGCAGAKDLTPEQVQSAQYIAEQLDTEVRRRVRCVHGRFQGRVQVQGENSQLSSPAACDEGFVTVWAPHLQPCSGVKTVRACHP